MDGIQWTSLISSGVALLAVSDFVFERSLRERDAMASTLNRLFLFASP